MTMMSSLSLRHQAFEILLYKNFSNSYSQKDPYFLHRYVFFFTLFDIYLLYCRYDLSLNFEESIFGGQKDIEITRFETCTNCNGTGAKSSACLKSCADCGGRGRVMKTQRTPYGTISKVI